jgi:arylsulfatase A-like enzyme
MPALQRAGYTTARVGKWHISAGFGFPTPIQPGFDEPPGAHCFLNYCEDCSDN